MSELKITTTDLGECRLAPNEETDDPGGPALILRLEAAHPVCGCMIEAYSMTDPAVLELSPSAREWDAIAYSDEMVQVASVACDLCREKYGPKRGDKWLSLHYWRWRLSRTYRAKLDAAWDVEFQAVIGAFSIDGLEEDALDAGLLVRVPYDPAEHGPMDDVEEGDMICVERERLLP